MLGGMPVNAFVIAPLVDQGWRVVQAWDEYDGAVDRAAWTVSLAEAALVYAGGATLVSGKSAGSLATGFAADHDLAGIWTTPLLGDETCADGLRRRTQPAMVIGGPEDPAWNRGLARELADDVVEIPDADHGLARLGDLAAVEQAVARFSGFLRTRG
jgi:pimeloyl-ACP methyl ester carboxylesterase